MFLCEPLSIGVIWTLAGGGDSLRHTYCVISNQSKRTFDRKSRLSEANRKSLVPDIWSRPEKEGFFKFHLVLKYKLLLHAIQHIRLHPLYQRPGEVSNLLKLSNILDFIYLSLLIYTTVITEKVWRGQVQNNIINLLMLSSNISNTNLWK